MWSCVFPGQGSQHIGMGRYLYDNFDLAKQRFEEASDLLSLNFKKLLFDGTEEELARNSNVQPALALVSITTLDVLKNIAPTHFSYTAGHSAGEYTAMVAAEAMTFAQAITIIRKRGQAIEDAVSDGDGGMMALLGLTTNQVQKVCDWAVENSGYTPLEIANDNAPGQIVISGNSKALSWLKEQNPPLEFYGDPEPRRVKYVPLNVSRPCHCSMLHSAQKAMAELYAPLTLSEAQIPVIQNYTAKAVTDPKTLKENLVLQVKNPVRWKESVQAMEAMGVKKVVECGSQKVLTGLTRRISPNLETFSINSLESLQEVAKLCTT